MLDIKFPIFDNYKLVLTINFSDSMQRVIELSDNQISSESFIRSILLDFQSTYSIRDVYWPEFFLDIIDVNFHNQYTLIQFDIGQIENWNTALENLTDKGKSSFFDHSMGELIKLKIHSDGISISRYDFESVGFSESLTSSAEILHIANFLSKFKILTEFIQGLNNYSLDYGIESFIQELTSVNSR